MNSLPVLSSILGLGFASGVNLYAAVLVVGLGERLGWIGGLPGDLNVLASPWILTVAGVMYFLEFFADKIPYVSIAWDAIHTFIRPLGGAALALASAAHLSPEMQMLALLAGGSIALGTHSTKMSYRLLAHASPEPVSDSIFSVAEDAGVAGLVLLTYHHPLIAASLVAVLLLGIALVLPLLWRMLSFAFQGLAGRAGSWFPTDRAAPSPAWLERELLKLPGLSRPALLRGFARRIPKTPRMVQGFLIASGGQRYFAYKGWFRTRVIPLDPGPIETTRGLLFDQLHPTHRKWSVYLTKAASKAAASAALQSA